MKQSVLLIVGLLALTALIVVYKVASNSQGADIAPPSRSSSIDQEHPPSTQTTTETVVRTGEPGQHPPAAKTPSSTKKAESVAPAIDSDDKTFSQQLPGEDSPVSTLPPPGQGDEEFVFPPTETSQPESVFPPTDEGGLEFVFPPVGEGDEEFEFPPQEGDEIEDFESTID